VKEKLPLRFIKHTPWVRAGQPTNHTNKQTNKQNAEGTALRVFWTMQPILLAGHIAEV
jgi:hypothetical protein